jgi:protein TonB
VIPVIVALVVLLAIIVALSMRPHKPQQSPSSASLQPPPSMPDSTKGAVANRVLPDVPRRATRSIRGTVKLAIRVKVDESGAVSDATLASRGPSKYFARLALESAHSWRFTPAQVNGHPVPSVWILRYEFKSSGTDITPLEEMP